METVIDPNYVRARSGLLDALSALGPLRDAAVLVGAQAIYEYLRDQAADFAVSPFTFDADLVLVPELLTQNPRIVDAMSQAGYALTDQPGIYKRDDDAQVDLLVPQALGGRKGRGAELGVHGNRAARQVRGLEGALVSSSPTTIKALVAGDDRAYEINVAGPAALLVAKVHKLSERVDANAATRLNNKDAFDIFRLLRAVEVDELANEVDLLLTDPISASVALEAMTRFHELFGTRAAAGTQLVAQHVEGLEDLDSIIGSSVALSQELLEHVSNALAKDSPPTHGQ